jgi:hypothetical protein
MTETVSAIAAKTEPGNAKSSFQKNSLALSGTPGLRRRVAEREGFEPGRSLMQISNLSSRREPLLTRAPPRTGLASWPRIRLKHG